MFSTLRDRTLPLSSLIIGKDGRLSDNITLQIGDGIIISTPNCNRDPAIGGAANAIMPRTGSLNVGCQTVTGY